MINLLLDQVKLTTKHSIDTRVVATGRVEEGINVIYYHQITMFYYVLKLFTHK
jgi:hypothetical protein